MKLNERNDTYNVFFFKERPYQKLTRNKNSVMFDITSASTSSCFSKVFLNFQKHIKLIVF
jgi:hypothetical protein